MAFRKQKNLTGGFIKSPIKKGDTVQVIAGDDKGHVGKVLKVNTKRINGPYLIVTGVNIRTHFVKKQAGQETGEGTVKKESWIHVSNVKKVEEQHVDKK